jgi:tetratricopeptide (TPR) repeat protein
MRLTLSERIVCRYLTILAMLFGLSMAAGCRKPPDAGNPSDGLDRGWRHFQIGEFTQATDQFEAARNSLDLQMAPQDDVRRLQALYGLGQTWDLGRRDESGAAKAIPFYQQIITAAPNSDLAAWSMLALARSQDLAAAGAADTKAVQSLYQKVVDRFPSHPAGEEAFMYIQTLRLVGDHDTARATEVLTLLDQFIAGHRSSRFVSEAYSLKAAWCCQRIGKPQEKLTAMEKAFATREVDPANPRMDNAAPYWSLATTAEFDAGDFAIARKYYRLLRSEYPTDQRSFPAAQQLQRMDAIEARLRRELSISVPSTQPVIEVRP